MLLIILVVNSCIDHLLYWPIAVLTTCSIGHLLHLPFTHLHAYIPPIIINSIQYLLYSSPGADNKTCLWDVGTGEVLAEIGLPDLLFGLNFNMNGEKLVSTSKDKMVRVHNARTLEVVQQGKAHDGAKAAQAVFTRDDRIFTTGFSRMSDRQYSLWAVVSIYLQ